MVLDKNFKAIPENIDIGKELTNFSASYLHRLVKLEKGESRTIQPI
jgi:hypothetical protein